MLKEIISRTFLFVKQKRVKKAVFIKMFSELWTCIFICTVSVILCPVLPAACICAALVLSVRVKSCFIDVYKGRASEASDVERIKIKQPLIVMLVTKLKIWVLILIPFAGIFLSAIRSYEYRFVPYILAEDNKISARGAMERSLHATVGFKKTMFALDALLLGVGVVPCGALFILSKIPILGIVFGITAIIYAFIYAVMIPFVRELVFSVLYAEVSENNIQPVAKAVYCPFCMSKMDSNCMFCSNCGEKLAKAEAK